MAAFFEVILLAEVESLDVVVHWIVILGANRGRLQTWG